MRWISHEAPATHESVGRSHRTSPSWQLGSMGAGSLFASVALGASLAASVPFDSEAVFPQAMANAAASVISLSRAERTMPNMIRSMVMVRCSFCGKGKDEVERLIQGGGKQPAGELPIVFICNECIDLCANIIHPPSPPTVVTRRGERPEPRYDKLYLPLTPWAEIEVDGERYRWSSARVTVSGLDAGKLTQARPMVMLSVGKLGEPAVGVMYEDGTEPTLELAVETIRSRLGPE